MPRTEPDAEQSGFLVLLSANVLYVHALGTRDARLQHQLVSCPSIYRPGLAKLADGRALFVPHVGDPECLAGVGNSQPPPSFPDDGALSDRDFLYVFCHFDTHALFSLPLFPLVLASVCAPSPAVPFPSLPWPLPQKL